MTTPNIIRQDEINVIFVRSELDDARLTPHEFRIYAHIARRSNCFASLESMADICQMSQATIKRVLASLKEKGMIDLISRPGTTHLISITPPRVWSDQTWANIELSRKVVLHGVERPEPSSQGAARETNPAQPELPTQLTGSYPPSSQGATKDIPLRESQVREEKTVAAEAAPLPPEELRSLKAKPHSPTPSSAPAPSPCPWHLQHGVSLPESLRTQNCLEAAKLWLQYKRERDSSYKRTGLQTMVGVWGRGFTPATFPRAVEHSVASNYQGLYPHPDDKGKRDSAPKPAYDDPFPGMTTVTLADINAKFGYGQASVMWAKRMRDERRMP